MDTGGQFAVSESGGATYTIPIQVPPGTAGMEPKLALSYNSQGGNGLLGVGWNLSGLSAITRCPRTMAQDGARGGINFDANDRFCLDGQRLMVVSGTYGAAGSEYRTERDSFSNIVANGGTTGDPTWFQVKTKAGQVIEYGNTTDSRIEAQGKTQARAWAITQIKDRKDNCVRFGYDEQNADGDYRPLDISYSGRVVSGVCSGTNARAHFEYETRPDIVPMYLAGSLIRNTVRLKTVQTFLAAANVKQYGINYETGSAAGVSRVVSVSNQVANCMPNGLNICPPNLVFTNTDGAAATGTFTASVFIPEPDVNDYSVWSYGDFNGDGRKDITYQSTALGLRTWKTLFSNGDGTFTGGTPYVISDIYDFAQTHWSFQDFNGDGKTDFIYLTNIVTSGLYRTWRVMLANGDGTYTPRPGQSVTDAYSFELQYWSYGDFNGDGRTDIIYLTNATGLRTWKVLFSNGDGTFTAGTPQVVNDPYAFTADYWTYGDFNGDGKTDIFYLTNLSGNQSWRVLSSNGDGTFTFGPYVLITDYYSYGTAFWSYGDFNGDGKQDLIYLTNVAGARTWKVKFSAGNGTFVNGPLQAITDVYSIDAEHVFWTYGDSNGDGKTDIFYLTNAAGSRTWRAALSKGNGTFALTAPTTIASDVQSFSPPFWSYGDFSGDGKADILYRITTLQWRLLSANPINATDNLVSTINNGLSISQNLNASYLPLTSASVYTKGSSSIYPTVDVQAPMYVVSSVQSSNGIGGTLTTNYQYGGLKAESGTGRGLLGFGWVQATQVNPLNSSDSTTTRTDYRQDWPYVGLPSQVRKTQPSVVLHSVWNLSGCWRE